MTAKSADKPKTETKRRKASTKKERPLPSRDEIARLAEKYWAERGWPEGSPEQDWLRAEQELMGRAS